MAQTGTYATRLSFGVPVGYSPSQDNIGNLKKETYLEDMQLLFENLKHKTYKTPEASSSGSR